MLRPCKDCPFRKDVDFPLGKGRREEIVSSILSDNSFGCHKTTYHDEDGNYEWTEKERPCAGVVFLVESITGSFFSNFMFRLYFVLMGIQMDVDPNFHQVLCKTKEEFLSLDPP